MLNLSKSYEIPKAIISTGLSKAGESLKGTISTAGSQLGQTISATAAPSWEYVKTITSKAPGTFKADVIDTTLSDLKFTGFTKTPIKSTTKALFSPVMVMPRAGWSVLKSGWSMTTTAMQESPKLLWDTTTTALGGTGKVLATGVKGLTGLAGAGLAAIDAGVDVASGGGSKPEAKK